MGRKPRPDTPGLPSMACHPGLVMLNVHTLRTLLLPPGSGLEHLSAASGLVRVGQRLYVIADDEHLLGMFDLADGKSGALQPLFAGALPATHGARKAAKPDLESLTWLPPFAGHPQGALLALGSGSRPQRQRAVLLPLDTAGTLREPVFEIHLSPLYAPLALQHPQLNIEGAFVCGDRFCLLQRGNAATPVNALIVFDWSATKAWLCGQQPAPPPLSSARFALGELDGVPLCFTDGTALPGGGWVFSAAAEASGDNYADGPCRGSAIGLVADDGRLRGLWPVSLRCKVEGIAVTVEHEVLHLLLVTDADDRGTPAALLSATLDLSKWP